MQTRTILGLAVISCALLGCKPEAPAVEAAETTTPATPAAPQEFVIRTRDFVFADVPDTIQSGVTTIKLLNEGPDMHHVQLVRIDEGHTFEELMGAMSKGGAPPAWAVDVGGPNTPVPGGETSATLDLKPGAYAMICFIPAPDGQPHVMKGMVRPLTVVQSATASAPMPPAQVTMTLNDYSFDTSIPLVAGTQVINVTNAAAQSHEVLVVKLEPGKTVEDLVRFIEKPAGAPPGAPVGGTTGIKAGETNQITLNLVSGGEYAFICFIPDAKDGKPHVMHGMAKQFKIS